MLVEAIRAENVNLGVQPLGGMGAEFDLLGDDVIHKLDDSLLDFLFVGGTLDIGAELVLELLERFGGVRQEEKALAVVVGHDRVHVDAHENANVRHLVQVRANGEITGGSQEAYQGVKGLDVRIVIEDPLELFEEGLLAVVGKEAGGHGGLALIAAGGVALTGQQHLAVSLQRHLPGNRSRYGSGPHDG